MQSFLEMWQGLGGFPLSDQGDRQIIVGPGIIRFELERPLEMLNGLSQLPLLSQRGA